MIPVNIPLLGGNDNRELMRDVDDAGNGIERHVLVRLDHQRRQNAARGKLFERRAQAGPIERAVPGNHVIMLSAGDVFDVQVPDPLAEQPNRLRKRSRSRTEASVPKALIRVLSASSGRSGVARM